MNVGCGHVARGWGGACAAFALLVWGMTFASTRALLMDFSALEIMVLRFVIAWVVLGCLEMAGRRSRGTRASAEGREAGRCWRDEAGFAAMGLTGVAVYQFLENCAIYYTNASNVAILVSFGPIVTAVFARLFTRDRSLSPRLVAGSLVAVAGVALVSFNGVADLCLRPLGDVMALGAMLSWGVYSALVERVNARGVPPLVATRKAFGWSLVFLAPLVLWGATASGFYALDGSFSVTVDGAENAARFLRPLNLVNLAFLGVLASALSFIAWSKACAAFGVVRTTVCLYLEPVVGVGFAVLALGERPTRMCAAGGLLILAGVVAANWKRKGKVG